MNFEKVVSFFVRFFSDSIQHKAYDDTLIEETDSILEQDAKDQKIATTETSEDLNAEKNVGPKWRIIINKHAGENKT
nr:unnamed protein product [Callosobruchus chinensis]